MVWLLFKILERESRVRCQGHDRRYLTQVGSGSGCLMSMAAGDTTPMLDASEEAENFRLQFLRTSHHSNRSGSRFVRWVATSMTEKYN